MTDTTDQRTQNEAWDFYGTMAQIGADPAVAWGDRAMAAIARATGCAPFEVRAVLDSRSGRHFADEAASTGIEAAVAKWMGWRTTRRDERQSGIPAGLPYLYGHVTTAAGIETEQAA